MWDGNRRHFLETTTAIAAGSLFGSSLLAQTPLGERPQQHESVKILFPRDRGHARDTMQSGCQLGKSNKNHGLEESEW